MHTVCAKIIIITFSNVQFKHFIWESRLLTSCNAYIINYFPSGGLEKYKYYIKYEIMKFCIKKLMVSMQLLLLLKIIALIVLSNFFFKISVPLWKYYDMSYFHFNCNNLFNKETAKS